MEPKVREETRAWNDNREPVARPQSEVATAAIIKKHSLRKKWRNLQLSKTQFFWILVAGMVLTMIVGFRWGGWVTGGTALRMADTAAKNAVVSRLAPICVAQFNLDPQKDLKLAELQAASSYQRDDYVAKQGWATMVGEETPTSGVADACAKLLTDS
jgi:hypothetical protein